MAMFHLLLALSQLTLVNSHPAAGNKQAPEVLNRQAIDISTNIPATRSFSSAIEGLQSATAPATRTITGNIFTALPSGGGITQNPINGPGVTITQEPLVPDETSLNPGPTSPPSQASPNIFSPIIGAGPPPDNIGPRDDHAVPKEHIVDGDVPIQTNKFYANFFLGSQTNPVWTHPYSLSWANGRGGSYGMAVSHVERSQFTFGPDPQNPQYFISPIGTQHMVLSADELGVGTVMSTEGLTGFSVYANFAPSASDRVLMTIPVVQGMGFVTAIYNGARPMIKSGVLFNTLEYIGNVDGVTFKYAIQLEDGSQWLLYATPVGAIGTPPFILSRSEISGPRNYVGMIQVTKNPNGEEGERVFDRSAGSYPMDATISGSVDGSSGSYTLSWTKGGVRDKTLLMYALPHHVESFDPETRGKIQDVSLSTTTKGMARAVLADQITMTEPDLPDTIGFAPWVKASGDAQGGFSNTNLNAAALRLINEAGATELGQSFIPQTSLNSMYYSGKGLAKFAGIVYTMQTVAKNSKLAAAGLTKLKDAFNIFVTNRQPEPLVYDTVWKGVVSGSTYRPPYDTGLDFGNTLYNDHHFHYGYFVWTAAVIGHLDPAWLDEGDNRLWVNTLVRDYANPVSDEYFPFSRSFDWYHGHSWAKGLFESSDGKDQESSSEDTFATYALKMWGKVSGDANMHARGNLQLAVQARSIRNYFLLTSDNQNQPPQFLHNKVTGILFENKVDHTTYFGNKPEYIQGIHMIPLNPSSAYIRSKRFVREEWDTYFSNGRADQVPGGWKGILYANLALIDPRSSYDFFADPNFDYGILDGGASRTWYLAYSAAMLGGGAQGGYAAIQPPKYGEPVTLVPPTTLPPPVTLVPPTTIDDPATLVPPTTIVDPATLVPPTTIDDPATLVPPTTFDDGATLVPPTTLVLLPTTTTDVNGQLMTVLVTPTPVPEDQLQSTDLVMLKSVVDGLLQSSDPNAATVVVVDPSTATIVTDDPTQPTVAPLPAVLTDDNLQIANPMLMLPSEDQSQPTDSTPSEDTADSDFQTTSVDEPVWHHQPNPWDEPPPFDEESWHDASVRPHPRPRPRPWRPNRPHSGRPDRPERRPNRGGRRPRPRPGWRAGARPTEHRHRWGWVHVGDDDDEGDEGRGSRWGTGRGGGGRGSRRPWEVPRWGWGGA